MSGKYGSSSFAVFLVDGYSMLAAKVQGVTHKVTNKLQHATHGLGDAWEASNPTGLRVGALTQSGAFFDDSTHSLHDAWKNQFLTTVGNVFAPTVRIVCIAFAGNVIGRLGRGFEGAFGLDYEVLGKLDNLTNANVAYQITGRVDEFVILQEWATRTDDWSTAVEGNKVDDQGASSANGGYGYLQISDFEGSLPGVAKILHSSDGVTFSTLLTFPTITGGPQAIRQAVAGVVNRYLAFQWTGFGNISASASASASRSPSVSASSSSSPSLSPSASISPSRSTSLSPSASISPSASTSLSPSSSRSPSVSASASASPSLSPSASTSPSSSASPSGALPPSVQIFCGFARA